jgi:hypothetical protein
MSILAKQSFAFYSVPKETLGTRIKWEKIRPGRQVELGECNSNTFGMDEGIKKSSIFIELF